MVHKTSSVSRFDDDIESKSLQSSHRPGPLGWTIRIIIAFIGLAALLAGFVLWYTIEPKVVEKLRDGLSVSSLQDAQENHAGWLDTRDPEKGRPARLSVSFYAIQNQAAVNAGLEFPKVEVVGPYTWTEHKKKLNVAFDSSGDEVKFIEWTAYEWDAESSNPNVSESDSVTLLNPFSLGAKLLIERDTSGQTLGAMIAVRFLLDYNTRLATQNATSPATAPADVAALATSVAVQMLPGLSASVAARLMLVDPSALISANTTAAVIRIGSMLTLANSYVSVLTACGGSTSSIDDGSCAASAPWTARISAITALWPSISVDTSSGSALPASTIGSQFLYVASVLGTFNPITSGASRLARGDISTRSAKDWMFGATEPLVMQLLLLKGLSLPAAKAAATVGFFKNQTETQALEGGLYDGLRTGAHKKTQRERSTYSLYHNGNTITAYPKPITLRGTTGTDFGFKSDTTDPIYAFVSQIMRPVKLIPDQDSVTYMGIECYKMRLDPNEIAKNPDFNISTSGVLRIDGLNDLGIPFALTKPRFMDVEPTLKTKLQSTFNVSESAPRDDTLIYLEPYSGIVLRANQRLQINIEVPMQASATNYTDSQLFPLVIADRWGGATVDDAVDFQDALAKVKLALVILPGFLMGLGGVVCVLGVWLILKGLVRKDYRKPEPIVNDPKDLTVYISNKIKSLLKEAERNKADPPYLYSAIPQFADSSQRFKQRVASAQDADTEVSSRFHQGKKYEKISSYNEPIIDKPSIEKNDQQAARSFNSNNSLEKSLDRDLKNFGFDNDEDNRPILRPKK